MRVRRLGTAPPCPASEFFPGKKIQLSCGGTTVQSFGEPARHRSHTPARRVIRIIRIIRSYGHTAAWHCATCRATCLASEPAACGILPRKKKSETNPTVSANLPGIGARPRHLPGSRSSLLRAAQYYWSPARSCRGHFRLGPWPSW